MLEVFDYSNTAAPLSERPITTVAPQSLLLSNDEFMQQQAVALAGRLRREADPSEPLALVDRGFLLAVGRLPTPRERQLSLEFLQRQGAAFAALASRLTFKPDAPSALYEGYFNQLPPNRFLVGPAAGWSYYRGSWASAYEGIRSVDRDRGPAALCDAETFADGEIRGRVRLSEASESLGLLLRSTVQGDVVRGYELALDVRAQVVRLRRHAATVTTLAERSIALSKGQAIDLRFRVVGAKLSVWIGDGAEEMPTQPAWLEMVDSQPLSEPGKAGLRAAGSAVNVDRLTVGPVGRSPRMLRDELAPAAEEQALRSFCLLLLNLNEVVYID
jgi:hypothetical protein